MTSLKLAVWDMDGTLIDSRRSIAHALAAAFEGEGLPAPSHDQSRRVVGLSLDEALRRLAPPEFTRERAAALSRRYKAAFAAHRASPDFDEPMFEGALATLTRLKRDGWLLAVATGKSRRGVRAAFDAHSLDGLFDAVACADDGPGKPHPFMTREAMAAVGATPGRTVVIGDSEHDIGMALAAGARAVGVSWGFGAREELAGAGAHVICDSFAELDRQFDTFPHGAAA